MKKNKAFILMIAVCAVVLGVAGAIAQTNPLYQLPSANAPLSTGGTMDLSTNGRTLVVSNMLNDTISLVDVAQRILITEVVVGEDPRGVSLTPDDGRVLVVNRADGTLSVVEIETQSVIASYPVGVLPYAVVTTDDQIAYVSLQGEDAIIAIDYTTGAIVDRIATPDAPFGLTLWGDDFLYVSHLWSADFSLIYLPQSTVTRTISTGDITALSPSIAIDRTEGRAYLPQSRSYANNPALTFDSAVMPEINVVDLTTLGVVQDDRVTLDLADRPVNMPFAVAYDPVREWIFAVNAGTNDVSIIETASGIAVGHIPVGSNPRHAILSFDNVFLYVHNALEGSVTVVNTRDLVVDDVLPISDLRVTIDELFGAELFHTAEDPRMGARTLSCASCHFDGGSDGRVWAGVGDEPLNTPVLYDLLATAPYNWAGDWDELTDAEIKIRELQFGSGLLEQPPNPALGEAHAGLSLDLDLLAVYVGSLDGPVSPYRPDSETLARGMAVFEELDCASCHSGEHFTDGMQYDVGTGGDYDTPTLLWLWQSAPYFHDGRAETLTDVFVLPGAHQVIDELSADDVQDLVDYLLSLPDA